MELLCTVLGFNVFLIIWTIFGSMVLSTTLETLGNRSDMIWKWMAKQPSFTFWTLTFLWPITLIGIVIYVAFKQ